MFLLLSWILKLREEWIFGLQGYLEIELLRVKLTGVLKILIMEVEVLQLEYIL